MKIKDKGILIHIHKFSERDGVGYFLSEGNGVFTGVLKNIKSKSNRAFYTSGNIFDLDWFSRLEDQLGVFDAKIIQNNSQYFMMDSLKLNMVLYICFLLKNLLAEKEEHKVLYNRTIEMLNFMKKEDGLSLLCKYFFWEAELLHELGYGLDLSRCNATGVCEDLHYISPKTGKAVSKVAGEPYKEKLFIIPNFIKHGGDGKFDEKQLSSAFDITNYFLKKHLISHLKEKDLKYSDMLRKEILNIV